MSHRKLGEGRAPGLRFAVAVLVFMLVLYGFWWLIWEAVT